MRSDSNKLNKDVRILRYINARSKKKKKNKKTKKEEEIKVAPTFSHYENAKRLRHPGWKITLGKLRGERISTFIH